MNKIFFPPFSRIQTVFFSVLFLFIFAAAASGSPFDIYPDLHSGSYSRGPFSSLQNPVFSAVDGDARFAYRFMINDDEKGGAHLLMLRLLGVSFTYGYFDTMYNKDLKTTESANSSYFNINKGFFIYDIIGFGIGYSMAEGGSAVYDNYQGWSFGFLLRPFWFMSLGISITDVGGKIGGSSIPRRETYSLSLRPYTHHVTLSFDAVREGSEGVKKMDYYIGTEVILPKEISLYLRTDINWNMRFGISMPLHFTSPRSSTVMLDYYRTVSSGRELNSLGFSIPLKELPKAVTFPMGQTYLVINLNRKILEQEQGGFLSKRKITFTEIIQGLRQARKDRNIDGIVLRIEKAGLGFAQAQEIRDELALFKKTGRPVYAIMKDAGNREYYLAAIADRIYFTPNSTFNLTALSAKVYFLKDLLDKVGIEMEEVRHGKYKSANETFTRSHLSPEAKENLESLLNDINNQYLADIKKNRSLSDKTIAALFNEGIITPEEARTRGFIDRVMYDKEAFEDISKSAVPVNFTSYIQKKDKHHRWGFRPAIAVVHVTGTIIRGKSSSGSFATTTGDRSYKKHLADAFGNPAVRAVIVRVDSGGGSASASDYMLKYLMDLKKETGKPVIFSFGNIAASGGYFIASTGDPVLTSRGTITGSIGVISGKLNLEKLYKKLGINRDVIKLSEFADIFDESRSLTVREREVLQKGTDFIYDLFTGVVMKSRKLTKKEMAERAEGRVFTGSQAIKQKLADKIGGISAAIELARTMAGIKSPHRILLYPSGEFSFKKNMEGDDIRAMRGLFKTFFRHIDPAALSGERLIYKLPYRIEIE